jgi:NAD(P)H-flavin reductase/nitrite reductase/ring-hydroxylating ferredoxin subunit
MRRLRAALPLGKQHAVMLSCACARSTSGVPLAPHKMEKDRPAAPVLAPPLGAPSLAGFAAAGLLDQLPLRSMATFTPAGGARLCVVHDGAGRVHAIADACPHKQASMATGDIEDAADGRGCAVKCPRHRKRFPGGLNVDCESGQAWTGSPAPEFDPAWRAGTYRALVHVHEGRKWVMVGTRERGGGERAPPASGSAAVPSRTSAAGVHGWVAARVTAVDQVTPDTRVYSLQRAGELAGSVLADPASWHVALALRAGPGEVSREYTPVSSYEEWRDAGVLRLLIKLYPDGRFTGGSSGFAAVAAGAHVVVSGAVTTLDTVALLPRLDRGLLLVAGGTGVTAVLQLASWAVRAAVRPVHVLASARTASDILLRRELSFLGREGAIVVHTVTREGVAPVGNEEEAGVAFAHGRISAALLRTLLLPGGVQVVVCGPAGMGAGVAAALRSAGSERSASALIELEE